MKLNPKFYLIVIIILLFSILTPLSKSFEPIYDAHGHLGDETMSMSLAYNSYENKVPSYGYKATGDLWTQGFMTAPLYFLSYGAFISDVDPIHRIDSARTLSRILFSLSLFLCIFSLFYLYWNQMKDLFELLIFLLLVACISFVFLFKDTFIFVSSFSRVDAIGLFFVCLNLFSMAVYLIHKNRWLLFLCGLTCILSFFSNYFAFTITCSILFMLFLYHMASNKTIKTIKEITFIISVLLGLIIILFLFFNFVLLHISTKSDFNESYSGSFLRMVDKLVSFKWELFSFPLYQGFTTIIIFLLAYALLLFIYSLVHSTSSKIILLIWGIAFPIILILLAYAVFGNGRDVYTPMLFTPPLMILLFLILLIKDNKMIRVVSSAVLLVLLLFITKPIQHNNLYHEINMNRNQHLQSLVEWMDKEQIQSAFATDPIFTLLDSDDRKFYFLYDIPKSEYIMFKQFSSYHIITNKFGNESQAATLSFPRLKEVMSKDSFETEFSYPEGTVKLTKVFETSSTIPNQYTYGGADSTPFWVFKVSYE